MSLWSVWDPGVGGGGEGVVDLLYCFNLYCFSLFGTLWSVWNPGGGGGGEGVDRLSSGFCLLSCFGVREVVVEDASLRLFSLIRIILKVTELRRISMASINDPLI